MTKNNVFRKSLVIGIIILFVGASVLPSIRGNINNKNDINSIQQMDNQSKEILLNDWVEKQKLHASDGESRDFFGVNVAIWESYTIIGTSNCYGSENCTSSIYVFRLEDGNWVEDSKLQSSDDSNNDYFGNSIGINGDYIIIGACWDDDNGIKSGAAYIFKNDNGNWIEDTKLLPSDGDEYDRFGCSVAIFGDYALIGSRYADDNGQKTGSAYVFKLEENNWVEEAKLLASDGEEYDQFGYSVAINEDTAIIGSLSSQSAYVFKLENGNWVEDSKLQPSDGPSYGFGYSTSIYENFSIIGAIADDDNGPMSGSAYIFKNDNGNWIEDTKLLPSDGNKYDNFSKSVSINKNYAIVGSYGRNKTGVKTGCAYIFKHEENSWIEKSKLLPSDGVHGDGFGGSVSIYRNFVVIGSPYDDDNGEYSGSAYIFTRESDNQPPDKPIIDGQTSGKPGTEYEYTFNAVDPDSDNVKYHIDWDDGDSETTTEYPSGTDVKVKHTWSTQGTYTITAYAEDTHGLVGPEGTLSVSMPRNKAINTPFLNFLEQYPILYQLLQRFLRL